MATTIQGNGGDVTLPNNFFAKLSVWSADINVSVANVTAFDSKGYQENRPCIVDITGSAAGTAEFGAAGDAPVSVATLGVSFVPGNVKGNITLTATGNNDGLAAINYVFDCVVFNIRMSRPINGKMDISFDFASTGAIAQTW